MSLQTELAKALRRIADLEELIKKNGDGITAELMAENAEMRIEIARLEKKVQILQESGDG